MSQSFLRPKDTRITADYYPTPVEAIDSVMDEIDPHTLSDSGYDTWLEPMAGDMRIYNRLPEGRREWAEIREGRDYFAKPYPTDNGITNPAFSIAEEAVRKMLQDCRTVIILQRLNWMGSQKRRGFWQANPPSHLFTLSKRPIFVKNCKAKKCRAALPLEHEGPCPVCGGKVGKGTDSTEYGWYAWDRNQILKRRPGIYVI